MGSRPDGPAGKWGHGASGPSSPGPEAGWYDRPMSDDEPEPEDIDLADWPEARDAYRRARTTWPRRRSATRRCTAGAEAGSGPRGVACCSRRASRCGGSTGRRRAGSGLAIRWGEDFDGTAGIELAMVRGQGGLAPGSTASGRAAPNNASRVDIASLTGRGLAGRSPAGRAAAAAVAMSSAISSGKPRRSQGAAGCSPGTRRPSGPSSADTSLMSCSRTVFWVKRRRLVGHAPGVLPGRHTCRPALRSR